MKTFDIIAAVLIILLGLLHCMAVLLDAPAVAMQTNVWELSGGLFMILVGVLNLLRVRYGAVARGVKVVSAAANIVLLGLTLALAGALGMAHHLHSFLVVAVVVIATILSFLPVRKQARGAVGP